MKLRTISGITLLTIILLWGCATTYGPKKLVGGYSEVQENPTTVEVTFEGNQYSNRAEIRTYLTYRCSEVTLEQGYTHFMIIEDNSFKELGSDELHDDGITFSTTSSMSGGVNTRVSSGFEKVPTENIIGIFKIKILHGPDPVFAAASIDAQLFISNNEHLIKRKK